MRWLTIKFNTPNKRGEGYIGKYFGKVVLPPQKEKGYYDILEFVEKPNYILAKKVKKHVCKEFNPLSSMCIACGAECLHPEDKQERTVKMKDDPDCHDVIEKCSVCGREFIYSQKHKFEPAEEPFFICKICGYKKRVGKYEYEFLKEKPETVLDFIKLFNITKDEVSHAYTFLSSSFRDPSFLLWGRLSLLKKVKDFLNSDRKLSIDKDYNVYFSKNLSIRKITRFEAVFDKLPASFLLSLEDTNPIGYKEVEVEEEETKKKVFQKLSEEYGKLLKHAKFVASRKINIDKLLSILNKKLSEAEKKEEEREKKIENLRLKEIFNQTSKYLPVDKFEHFIERICEELQKAD